ncbi:MAG: phosphoribosylamine--glycine ligase [Omnitrophica WOR_2 bacterium RIFCSPHIGHO2_01_FULL_48_9]|nr:MAG: phosphoribosylamine--glycine ligase [Omnitrophica WOR_2 bacterium RIFCSPHIGHO2_02_FULL_48_11]OGX31721.1 MAG: phosphoribosylamine--glycine ligase [Omnitrophica WOR_2 bacterium RIFCSPHIGHO2_01_FULL_48_9]
MKILIIGSGGREHALAWKIKQSPRVEKIYCAPGNGGISDIAECVAIEVTDIPALIKFAKEKKIDLTVVGPEAPLVAGIVNDFEKAKLRIFGPSREAAQLEGSKVFAKEFMHRRNIPTAVFKVFEDLSEAKKFLQQAQFPLVVKADGLAAGKGVVVCKALNEALEAVDQIMGEKIFKEAGRKIIIEECLEGEEVSILAISDGERFCLLEASQDHKRIFDDDIGPNTGGMGAYSPTPVVNSELMKKIEGRVIEPTIRGMAKEGNPFKGVLYAGLMITLDGPKVLEYNVRLGDPEAQAVLPRLKDDLVEIMTASCDGKITGEKLRWERRSCVCVVMSSGGYPGKYSTGYEITGLPTVDDPKTIIFHAGTKKEDGKFVTSGGRVLGVTSLGTGIEQAINRVYEAIEKIKFDHCFFRRDIGAKALQKANRDLSATPGGPGRR